MKKLYFLLLLMPLFSFAAVYPGNGNNGFGGGVGGCMLNITDDGSVITFQLATGNSGFSGNDLVIFIDNMQGGGYSNTSTFTDVADGGRTAISGLSANGRAQINFPAGFRPQKAISVEYGFIGLYDLSNPANFSFIASGNYNAVGNVITFTFNKALFGVPGGISFKFFGTLISTSGYRSNEAIGSAITDVPPNPGDSPNLGFTGTINPASFYTYGAVVVPVTLTQFTGAKQGDNTLLKWKTGSEINVSSFSVEQSTDTRNWLPVSNVNARNSATGADYSAAVRNLNVPVNYYRLKTLSLDSKALYSNVVAIKTAGAGVISIINSLAQNDVGFTVNQPGNKNISVFVYAQDGQLVSKREYRSGGANTLYHMPVNDLRSGLYFLKVNAGDDETASFRFVKQ